MLPLNGVDYYFHPTKGNDTYEGTSPDAAWQSLSKVNELELKPGDRILLAAGATFYEPLILEGVQGSLQAPILVETYDESPLEHSTFASIQVKEHPHAVWIKNSSFISLERLKISSQSSEGQLNTPLSKASMRCGVLVEATKAGTFQYIYLNDLHISSIFYEEEGVTRSAAETQSANGTQKYGWGIRFITKHKDAMLKDLRLHRIHVEDVAHTGIKFTGTKKNDWYSIQTIEIRDSKVLRSGGPGIQLSGVYQAYIHHNEVDRSGSIDDSRKWGRGSGLWTWSSSDILIEKNRFTRANGPGDSAGAHIDFNCRNIMIQYNFSANNAGGFCEILGNNHNCSYRYNISVNDGWRIKGQDGAFQEGKILWLSGYNGNKNPRMGPFNSYIYNNTIYVDSTLIAKLAIDHLADGVLIANNIFHIVGQAEAVLGDQYRPQASAGTFKKHPAFKNNLFYHAKSWPVAYPWQDQSPFFGDAGFEKAGGLALEDYLPIRADLVKDRGLIIEALPNDTTGLIWGLKVEHDILGKPIVGLPDLGAIELQQK